MTDNELIAEFMGCSKPPNPDFDYFWNGEFFKEYRAKWDKSWDWLMPVVEKIETPDLIKGYNFSVEILRRLEDNQVTIYSIVRDASFSMVNLWGRDVSKIKAVYKAVVEFIKWYNQNK